MGALPGYCWFGAIPPGGPGGGGAPMLFMGELGWNIVLLVVH